MGLGRRSFLQRLSLTLASLGLGEATISGWVGSYQRALAQPTQRKLALLIGIDQYPNAAIDPALTQSAALQGAVTDVELQRELLIYRFGFQPADILTLTNGSATRQNLLAAVADHLVQQAQAGDVVLLHFSGYGSQVRLSDQPEDLRRSLVPVDGLLPSEERPAFQDILQDELRGQLRSLKTHRITTLLDAGYRDLGQVRWGTLRVRSRPTIPTGTLAAERLAALSPAESDSGWPGLLLRAATPDRLVLEGNWADFSAGAFTYALTQTLWETLPPTSLQVVFSQVQEQLQRWTGPDQQPELTGKRRAESDIVPYHLVPLRPAAEGLITGLNAENRTVSLWMGGLAADLLENLQTNSRLRLATSGVAGETGSVTELVIQSRSGLMAAARLATKATILPEVGQPVYEQVRILPKAIDLVVALDAGLERVERVDATSALSGIPFVSFTLAGEQPADCLFGRLPQPAASTLTAALPTGSKGGKLPLIEPFDQGLERSYGLFAPNRTLVPGTLIAKGEAVKTAVNRLTPHLQSLLAMKLLRLMDNRHASQLAVRVSLESTVPEAHLLAQWEALRSTLPLPQVRLAKLVGVDSSPLQLSPNSRLRYRVSNYTGNDLFMALVSVDSRGRFLALLPDIPASRPDEERQAAIAQSARLSPGETRSIPEPPGDWGLPTGATWVETFLVLSPAPFAKTWTQLGREENTVSQPGLYKLTQPLKVAQALLADLHEGTIALNPGLAVADQYSLHLATWAALSFRYPIL